MPANRKDTLKIDGVVHKIVYLHNSNALVLQGPAKTYELKVVEGQYDLQLTNRRDLVANELLYREEQGEELTAEDLLPYGFRVETATPPEDPEDEEEE